MPKDEVVATLSFTKSTLRTHRYDELVEGSQPVRTLYIFKSALNPAPPQIRLSIVEHIPDSEGS